MSVIKNKNKFHIKSIADKLETISRITGIVMKEIEEFENLDSLDSRKLDFYKEVERLEIKLIYYGLFQAGGNQVIAAQILNMKTSTLNSKIKRFNIQIASVLSQRERV